LFQLVGVVVPDSMEGLGTSSAALALVEGTTVRLRTRTEAAVSRIKTGWSRKISADLSNCHHLPQVGRSFIVRSPKRCWNRSI
jgi:hypothetical protein